MNAKELDFVGELTSLMKKHGVELCSWDSYNGEDEFEGENWEFRSISGSDICVEMRDIP